jgi:hypothetical protein
LKKKPALANAGRRWFNFLRRVTLPASPSPDTISDLAVLAHQRHKRIVIEVAEQFLQLPPSTHPAKDERSDVLAATVGEVPRMSDTFPEGQFRAVNEPEADDVAAVRVNLLPELGLEAVGEA